MNAFFAHRLLRYVFIAAAVSGVVLSSGARAFTFEGQAAGNGDRQGFTDLQMPGKPQADSSSSSRFDSDGRTLRNGNTTFQFGSPQSFDQRYNPSNLFDPFAREGR